MSFHSPGYDKQESPQPGANTKHIESCSRPHHFRWFDRRHGKVSIVRRYRFSDLNDAGSAQHFLQGLLSGARLYTGGISFHPPNKVTHDEERPHVETDEEAFCLLQGQGWIEINGVREPVRAGDILVIEPGEDHHLISSDHDPLINLWLHANAPGHPNQFSTTHKLESQP